MFRVFSSAVLLAAFCFVGVNAQSAGHENSLAGTGRVLLIRHALAPGFGDPAEFKLGDCSTQRNLNETGRKQAVAMGEWLRSKGIDEAEIYSSEWCRCIETAELMKLGHVHEMPALNSFFQQRSKKKERMAALREFLAKQPLNEKLLIMVTHQVTITALTGIVPASGEGVVLILDGEGQFTVGPEVDFR
ncbi:histidine phosphatase family protein [Coraliomargarita sinensis]|uniref:Histidine phosphatase family protein n=1 Tax=Coraliomargarita sinensis TaxID=2174842 RepID=A0A317ZGB3_9BACT|nr:histidine phosphatase family protein [Coraliomargarita sinensis]